jgi:predicted dehydrogenase
MKTYQCKKSYNSLDELLKDKKIEAVAIYTGAPDHARHVIQTLQAGKHVLCAVPAAMTLEECRDIAEAVKRTGLTYMMAETSTYRQEVITARKFYKNGDFGNIFSSSARYYHPGLEALYFENGKQTWRHGLPPMLYPTHVTSFLISVTGERLDTVTCTGWGDDNPVCRNNQYNNPFWNETAFFKTNRGNAFTGEVCWKGALIGVESGDWHGDKMSFYMGYKNTGVHQVIATEGYRNDDGGFVVAEPEMKPYPQENWWQTDMLPQRLQHDSGHGGSHTFITNEFINAIVENRQPEVNITEALAYTVPGIIAHQSALKGGESLKIPVLG